MFDIWLFGNYFSSIQLNLFIDWFVADKLQIFISVILQNGVRWQVKSCTAEQTNPQNRLKIDYLTNIYLEKKKLDDHVYLPSTPPSGYLYHRISD